MRCMRMRHAGTRKTSRRKMSEQKMVIDMDKYICVFCNERKPTETAETISGDIGICRDCSAKLSRTSYSLPYPGTKNISYIMSPFEYTSIIKSPIIDFKFHNCRAYAPLFAAMMTDYLDSYNVWNDFDCIIPIPLHRSRLKERGYNQSELIAVHISDYLGLPLMTDAVIRKRATKRQSMLKGTARVENVRGAFKCTEKITSKRILLFDDICTTASTLESCAAAFKCSGAEYICALTLAIHVSQKIPIITY